MSESAKGSANLLSATAFTLAALVSPVGAAEEARSGEKIPTGAAAPITDAQGERPVREPHFLDNGTIRLGVDKRSGAAVFFFGESKTKRNLLNHYDRGRFVQQSYYGRADGTKWVQKPWRWNPVQGGNWQGKPSLLEAFKGDQTSLFARTIPHHWTGPDLLREVRMEERITLKGPVAEIKFRFHYRGEISHPARHQELPAVFMDYALPHLVFYGGERPWTGGKLTRVVPGWPNEMRKSTEHWAAFVDDKDWGCGVYFPGTTNLTSYRHEGEPGPAGSGCSYFAPVRTIAITKDFRLEYSVFLTIGTVAEIRARFSALRPEPAEPPRVPLK